VAFGALGWAADLGAAIVASGALMALLGLFVAARFTETAFRPAPTRRSRASISILRRGVALARADHEILLMLAATTTVNGASMVAWLFPKELVELGFPSDPILWFTALGILASALGAVALRVVQARIDAVGTARRAYALASFTGVLGLTLVAAAPNAVIASVGVLLVTGIAFSVTRAVSVIWVNRRTGGDVRATVHSFLSQAESVGEILAGFALAALAQGLGASATLVAAAVLMGVAGTVVVRSQGDRRPLRP
jgi:predicted MFS family arabinose efflux permease